MSKHASLKNGGRGSSYRRRAEKPVSEKRYCAVRRDAAGQEYLDLSTLAGTHDMAGTLAARGSAAHLPFRVVEVVVQEVPA